MAWATPPLIRRTYVAEINRVIDDGYGLRSSIPVVCVTTFDYDFAVSGDASAGIAISSQYVPEGARVLGGWYEILTTFTTAAANAGTIALSLVGANDLVTAIAVSDASAPWTLDLTKRRPLKGIATTLVARRQVTITSAVQLTTAGKLVGAVEWILPAWMSSGH